MKYFEPSLHNTSKDKKTVNVQQKLDEKSEWFILFELSAGPFHFLNLVIRKIYKWKTYTILQKRIYLNFWETNYKSKFIKTIFILKKNSTENQNLPKLPKYKLF